MSFWANKLNGQQVQAPIAPPRQLYPTGLPYTPQIPQQQTVSETYTPTTRLIQGSTCPGCGSSNYRATVGDRALACPECGYHPRFEQSGYGSPTLRGDTVGATPARQVDAHGSSWRGAVAQLNAEVHQGISHV